MGASPPAIGPLLLDFFFASALTLYFGVVLSPLRPQNWVMAGAVAGSLLVLAWALWRWRPTGFTAWVFAAVSIASFFACDNPMAFALQWVTLIVLAQGVGRLAAGVYGAVLAAIPVAVHVISQSGLPRIVLEGTAATLLVVSGLAFAFLMERAHTLGRQRDQMLAQLTAANERLQHSLRDSRTLALAQERERIAAALHDGLGHRLTTLGLSLDYATRVLTSDPDAAHTELTRAREDTSAALADMRATVRAMVPAVLTPGGIGESLDSLAASFSGPTLDVTCGSTDLTDMSDLSEEDNVKLLRFAQEALTNVVRHSGADAAQLRLDGRSLTVCDNGTGNDRPPSFGLVHREGRIDAEPHGGIDGGFPVTYTLPERS